MTVDHCPTGYSNAQAWCDWRNGELQNTGKRWIVGASGTPFLTDDPDWSAEHHERARRQADEERRRHNWRIMNPINNQKEVAE